MHIVQNRVQSLQGFVRKQSPGILIGQEHHTPYPQQSKRKQENQNLHRQPRNALEFLINTILQLAL